MIRWPAWLLLAMGAGAAFAQVLSDPTRPPGGLVESTEAVGFGGPVLQSVMLSPSRKVAVISGEVVALGGRYGGARLVKLTESEAVLKNGSPNNKKKNKSLFKDKIKVKFKFISLCISN